MIRIFIVDDHQVVIDGISSILSEVEEIKIIGSALNGLEALRKLEIESPDVLLLDINMPEMDGIQLVRALKEKGRTLNTLVLTMHNNPQFTKELIAEGVQGCVLKNAGKKDLILAITEVNNGGTFYSEAVTDSLKESLDKTQEAIDEVQLTKREVEIVKLIALENTTNEIAEKLSISAYTVDTHRKNIINKLGVKNLAGLVRFAFEKNLL
ncbi:response regulator transcription factor [uncultured Roseivirga sp.]|uniref:response regulator n=1 Tax=uncultured Roseivirga sp. TaxID=543088 RepID=UPI000D7B7EBD|nr:response regulator transcription factor [uncultured Roseivirga sp.]PWL28367.1 MAG: DNA-binding response regulator [Roseivirga sp. XM-24bin3]